MQSHKSLSSAVSAIEAGAVALYENRKGCGDTYIVLDTFYELAQMLTLLSTRDDRSAVANHPDAGSPLTLALREQFFDVDYLEPLYVSGKWYVPLEELIRDEREEEICLADQAHVGSQVRFYALIEDEGGYALEGQSRRMQLFAEAA